MTAMTLPRVAALRYGPGKPWYPMRPDAAGMPDEVDPLWRARPTLPEGWRWADDHEVAVPHLTLDETAVAELLYVAPVDPADRLGEEELAAVVLEQAERCGCDLSGPIDVIAQDAGDHPQSCQARMRWCRQQAARLLGAEA